MPTLGIDIGGTRIKAGLVAEDGELLRGVAEETPGEMDGLRRTLAGLIRRLDPEGGSAAAGVGCKGIIHPATTRVEVLPGTVHYLEGESLADLVHETLPERVPVFADNDARAALAGEVVWGAARGRSHVVMLTLGTGVGGAVLAEGRLLRGAGGVAGHLGHLTVDPDGAVCICGNRGCLETVFSARAIEAEAISAIRRGCDSSLTREYRDCPESVTCRAVFELAAQGDFVARVIRDRAMQYLAGAVAGLVHAYNPELVIVGGQISEAGEALFGPLRREVAWRTYGLLRRETPLAAPHLAGNSGIAGAAALAHAALRG
ncbi:MAG: ROK family protein [Bryobacterales bacterium]|nr:ROK family protein [Bryobacterales bacterium]